MVDDYGHHPTEILATLAAARQWMGGTGRIHVIFQPHRYTRTYLLMDEFAVAFPEADRLLVLDIYAASEQPIAGVSGLGLSRRRFSAGTASRRNLQPALPRPSRPWWSRRGRETWC